MLDDEKMKINFVDLEPYGLVGQPDSDATQADWPKRTWDLPKFSSAEELREYLRDSDISIAEFKKAPIYQLNRDRYVWLRDL